jgi:hypothetical protein
MEVGCAMSDVQCVKRVFPILKEHEIKYSLLNKRKTTNFKNKKL